MKRALAVLFVLLLPACAGSVQTRSVNSVAISCNSVSGVLEEMAKIKNTLSAERIKQINAMRDAARPVCSQRTQP